MVTFIPAVLLVSLTTTLLFTSGDACDKVPTMSREDACLKASSPDKGWYNVCLDTLRLAPDTAEVTAYALLVTRKALAKYNGTTKRIDHLLGACLNSNITVRVKLTLENCNRQYGEVRSVMDRIVERLSSCDLTASPAKEESAESLLNTCSYSMWAAGAFLYKPVEALMYIVTNDSYLAGAAYGLRDLAIAGNKSSVAGSTYWYSIV